VILLTRTPDLGFATRAFAAGVEDVVVLPQMIDTLAFSVRKLAELARRADGHTSEEGHATDGTVITVFSPKGGTGKTVLSTNLAATLAAERKERVLLVDLDLQFGDAAIMLGVDPERTICDLAKDPGQLDSEKLAAFTVHHPSGLDVLPAPIRPEEAELVSDEKVVRLVEVARGAYDTVVIDTSPFFYGPLLELLQPTDHLLLLCGLDVPTLKNVRISLRTLDLLGFPRGRTRLVLNRVTPNVGLTREDVERTLELPVEFEIPNDPAVARAVNRGAAPALLDAGSPFGVAIRNVVTRLHDGQPEQIASKETVRKLRWLAPSRLLEGRI
jgi:pilus assembly protein CpaE